MGFGNTLRDEMNKHPEQFDRIKLFPESYASGKGKSSGKNEATGAWIES